MQQSPSTYNEEGGVGGGYDHRVTMNNTNAREQLINYGGNSASK